MTLLSEELLADSGIDLEAYIAQEYKERIAVSEEEAFLVGDGIGKPLLLAWYIRPKSVLPQNRAEKSAWTI